MRESVAIGAIPYTNAAEKRAYIDGWLIAERTDDFDDADDSDEARKAEMLGVDNAFWSGYFDRRNL